MDYLATLGHAMSAWASKEGEGVGRVPERWPEVLLHFHLARFGPKLVGAKGDGHKFPI